MRIARILQQMWRLLMQEPGQTLRIMGPAALIWLLYAALSPFFLAKLGLQGTASIVGIEIAVKLTLFSWTAVNFHRHILLAEGYGTLPAVHGRLWARYALGLLLVTAIAIAVYLGLLLTLTTMSAHSTAPERARFIAHALPMAVAFAAALRLAGPLPALAVSGSYSRAFMSQERLRHVMAAIAVAATAVILVLDWSYDLLVPQLLARVPDPALLQAVVALLVAQALVQAIAAAFAISLLTAIHLGPQPEV